MLARQLKTFQERDREFADGLTSMPCMQCPVCCVSCFCLPCMNCYMRYQVLGRSLENYECCQGYMNGVCCFDSGFSRGSGCCLIVEAYCCAGLSVSSTRMYTMNLYDLRTDPCDERLIACSNCLTCLSIICNILAAVSPQFDDLAQIIDCLADVLFYSVAGCMHAQVYNELQKRQFSVQPGAPDAVLAAENGPPHAVKAVEAEAAIDRS
ncbi:hypothetical protein M885DRAFT_473383 [Pelagophyceae sp. CCMP2097]|nr:hypothetical protein M885DRAFT_473383 [Pelagophyceae sp. CCMP2097]